MTTSHQAKHSATLRIPGRHPSLAGHFPGNPIVPGVVVLDAVIAIAEAWLGTECRVAGLSHAKFLAPLKPDEEARIDLVRRDARLDFTVQRDGATIAKGTINVAMGAAA